MTTTKDTMTALRAMCNADFETEKKKAKKCCDTCYYNLLNSEIYFQYGHEAATNRLIGIVERAVEMAEGIENCALGGLDFTSEKKYFKMRSDVALKLAREFIETLRGFGGENG